jgi:hypothetical protein
MADNITLKVLFESHKTELEQKLDGFILPQDAAKVQNVIAGYLNKMFDSEGEFRQSLTQSEDYILQAAMSLLSAQQEISNTLLEQTKQDYKPLQHHIEEEIKSLNNNGKKDLFHVTLTSTQSMIGSAGGALVGKMILGGWGAVFGAIAGTAIAVYMASKATASNQNSAVAEVVPHNEDDVTEKPIDINRFYIIISGICESVDNLILIFRSQIKRVIIKYESQEKPSIDRDYLPLLENIQSLVGYSRVHGDDEKFGHKVQERIEDLADYLDTYDLTFVNYSEDKEGWFEKVSSPNTESVKMVYPAIVKSDNVVAKGKIFIPENK